MPVPNFKLLKNWQRITVYPLMTSATGAKYIPDHLGYGLTTMIWPQNEVIDHNMDEYNLWDDTMLIVNTDHGFLLGEHDWWAKCVQPFYNEVAHTPLFLWDPRTGRKGETSGALVQNIDWGPTLMEYGTEQQKARFLPKMATGEETDHAVLTPLLDVDGFVREQNTRLTGADSL